MNILLRASMAFAILTAASTLNAAQIGLPATLDTLLPTGDFAMVGGLKFDEFSYSKTGDMPDASGVNVLPIVDGAGNPGVRFQAGFTDASAGGPSDALITFAVTSDGAMISGAHMMANPDVLGGTPGTGLASITETFLPEVTNDSLSVYDDGNIEQLADSIVFSTPAGKVNVQKDIDLLAAQGGAGATVSFVDQTFSMVPEPGTSGLLLAGIASLGLIRRRR